MSNRYPRLLDGTWVKRSDPLWPVYMLSRGKPCFPVTNCLQDPGHPGFMLEFADVWNSSRRLRQATPAAQVAMPAAHADFAGAKCVTLTGAETYVANDAASNYAFFNDGTGAGLLFPFTPTSVAITQSFVCTTSAAGSRGLSFYGLGAVARSSVEKTGTSVYPDSSIGAIAANTATYRVINHGSLKTPQFDLRSKGTSVTSGAYASAAEAGAPLHTLRFGSNSGATLPARLRTPLIAFSNGWSANELEQIQRCMLSAFGISP